MTAAPDATGLYAPRRPVDLRQTLFPLRRGHADPTLQWTADGAAWRTQRTPEGIALIRMLARRSTALDGAAAGSGAAATEVELAAWGPGAAWSVRQAPELLGEGDDWGALDSLLAPGSLDDVAAPGRE